jgi:predicted lipoprotein with Yx(FWY)xxD motif
MVVRKLSRLSIGVIAAVAGCAAIAGFAQAASAATVNVGMTSRGRILVDENGFTLYTFTKDRKMQDNCVTVAGCTEVWPPLEVSGTPTAGPGVFRFLLSTIMLPDGMKQVTYAGHPLYHYTGDHGPGETSYIGKLQFGGLWYGERPFAFPVL